MSQVADPDGATCSQPITSLRAVAEGAGAKLTQRCAPYDGSPWTPPPSNPSPRQLSLTPTAAR